MRIPFLFLFILFLGASCFAWPEDSIKAGKLKHGQRNGTWTYYDQNQHISKVEKYRKGKLRQTYIFNSSGRVIERINRKGHVIKLRACGC